MTTSRREFVSNVIGSLAIGYEGTMLAMTTLAGSDQPAVKAVDGPPIPLEPRYAVNVNVECTDEVYNMTKVYGSGSVEPYLSYDPILGIVNALERASTNVVDAVRGKIECIQLKVRRDTDKKDVNFFVKGFSVEETLEIIRSDPFPRMIAQQLTGKLTYVQITPLYRPELRQIMRHMPSFKDFNAWRWDEWEDMLDPDRQPRWGVVFEPSIYVESRLDRVPDSDVIGSITTEQAMWLLSNSSSRPLLA